jgi:hypothetical protein
MAYVSINNRRIFEWEYIGSKPETVVCVLALDPTQDNRAVVGLCLDMLHTVLCCTRAILGVLNTKTEFYLSRSVTKQSTLRSVKCLLSVGSDEIDFA